MADEFWFEPPNFGFITVSDTFGGQRHVFNVAQPIVEDLQWLREYRQKLEQEEKLRESNPALRNAWDSYQTMLRIVMDDV